MTNSVKTKILAASAAAYCVANIGWWLQPAIIHEVMVKYAVKESAAGLLGSAEMVFVALGSILIVKLFDKFSLRHIAILGISVALIGTAMSILVQDYNLLLVSRSLAGVGEGAMLAVASASIANFDEPDKAYGKINIVAILFGSAAAFSLPETSEFFVMEHNVFPTILFGIALMMPFILILPNKVLKDETQNPLSVAPPSRDVISWDLVTLVLGTFLVTVTTGAMWTFFYVLGDMAGLSENQIHRAVAIAALLSVLGALLATLLGTKYGRFIPVIVGIVVLTITIVSMSYWHHPYIFRAAAILLVAGNYFVVPYFLGYAAAQDSSGRDAAVVAAAFLLTGAVGPYLGGYVIENFAVSAMAQIVVCANTVACVLFFILNRRQASSTDNLAKHTV